MFKNPCSGGRLPAAIYWIVHVDQIVAIYRIIAIDWIVTIYRNISVDRIIAIYRIVAVYRIVTIDRIIPVDRIIAVNRVTRLATSNAAAHGVTPIVPQPSGTQGCVARSKSPNSHESGRAEGPDPRGTAPDHVRSRPGSAWQRRLCRRPIALALLLADTGRYRRVRPQVWRRLDAPLPRFHAAWQ